MLAAIVATQVPFLLLFTILYLCVCVCVSCFYLFSFSFPFALFQCNTEAVSSREEEEGRSAGIFKTIDNSNPDASSARPSLLSQLQRDESALVDSDADPPSKNHSILTWYPQCKPEHVPFSPLPRSLMFY